MDYKSRYAQLDSYIRSERGYVEYAYNNSLSSFHAIIGKSYEDYCNIKQAHYDTPEDLIAAYMAGWYKRISFVIERSRNPKSCEAYRDLYNINEYRVFHLFLTDPRIQKYVLSFLERSFYKHFTEYTRVKPKLTEILWMGNNDNIIGLGLTPRWYNGIWENDKSEVRKVPFTYWTIGHVLGTGLLRPNMEDRLFFRSLQDFLAFYIEFVDRSGQSKYESELARLYVNYVASSNNPYSISLLIPQFRFLGLEQAHRYRLDFLMINPVSQQKFGFELSPFFTHGNKDAFERDNKKNLEYREEHDIVVNVYTDSQLQDIGTLFAEIAKYFDYETNRKEILNINIDKLYRLPVSMGVALPN